MKKSNIIISLILIVIVSACDNDDSKLIYKDNSGLLYQVNLSSDLYFEYI
jgi:hypothetical protein